MHHAHLVESVSVGNPAAAQALSGLQASGLDGAQSLALLDRLVNVQSYVLAADDIFYGSAVVFLALLPFVWITRRRKSAAVDAGGAH